MNQPVTEQGISLEEAQEIMGDNFLSPEKVLKFLKIDNFEREELQRVVGIACDKALLEESKNCILVPGSPFALLDFHRKIPESPLCPDERDVDDIWYIRESFAVDNQVDSCWYLTGGVLLCSLDKTYNEAEMLVKRAGEGVPFASELFYASALCHLIRGGSFLNGLFSFCQDVIDGCYHIHTGIFPPDYCFDVRHYIGLEKAENLGIAPVRRIPFIYF